MNEEEFLYKRFIELAKKSYDKGIFLFTDFLGLAEQTVFESASAEFRHVKYECFGGARGAERIMVRFGDEESFGYSLDFPICTLKCEPINQKFSDRLTHRDFLGALLNLGIERTGLGDIVIRDNVGYIFANEDIAPYIISELTRVKHTEVKTSFATELPEGSLYKTERRVVQISGERLDSLIAKLFSLSREKAQALFSKRLVFLNGKEEDSPAKRPKPNDTVSVRGYGRFVYTGAPTTSKKGKLNAELEIYV